MVPDAVSTSSPCQPSFETAATPQEIQSPQGCRNIEDLRNSGEESLVYQSAFCPLAPHRQSPVFFLNPYPSHTPGMNSSHFIMQFLLSCLESWQSGLHLSSVFQSTGHENVLRLRPNRGRWLSKSNYQGN